MGQTQLPFGNRNSRSQ